MAHVTRRLFFKRSSAGLVALGALASVPGLALLNKPAEVTLTEENSAEQTGQTGPAGVEPALAAPEKPLIAHVQDFKTGDIALMYGNQEFILRDPALVSKLLRAVH